MLGILIYILVIAVVAAFVYWVLDAIPVPQPLNRWLKIAVIAVAVIMLVGVLLSFSGVDIRGGLPAR